MKLAETIQAADYSHDGLILSDVKCRKCGTALYIYTGQDKTEWDDEECRMVDVRNGLTLPCHECRKRESLIHGEIGKLQHMLRKANFTAPDGMPESLEKKIRDEREKLAQRQRTFIKGLCERYDFNQAQLTERFATIQDRRAARREVAGE